jgi:surface polysaccharide O-acyltransferase-like enzyme
LTCPGRFNVIDALTRIQTDLVRFLSICAVLVIHATGQIEPLFARSQAFISAEFAGVVLNQWARFSVPVFVLLSGYGLGLRYRDSFAWKEFLERRLTRIGIPFLFWTMVFILAYRISWDASLLTGAGAMAALSRVADALPAALFTQGADYHFYFFIIILQCYLVFGLLRRTGEKTIIALALLHLLITSPSSRLLDGMGLMPGWHASFLVNWVFYFALGIYLSRSAISPAKSVSLILAALALFAVCAEFVYFALLPGGEDTGNYDHFARWSVTAYAVAAWFFLGAWSKPDLAGRMRTWLEKGAALSFSVFIFHTTVLRQLENTPLRASLFIIPALILASFALVWLLDLLVRPGWLRIIFGLPEKS